MLDEHTGHLRHQLLPAKSRALCARLVPRGAPLTVRTVYNFAHIGNFRAYLFEDLLQRHLEARGYAVQRVMNLTDVDDKTIRGCQQAGLPLAEFTAKYKEAFFQGLERLDALLDDSGDEADEGFSQIIALANDYVEPVHQVDPAPSDSPVQKTGALGATSALQSRDRPLSDCTAARRSAKRVEGLSLSLRRDIVSEGDCGAPVGPRRAI